MDVVSDAGLDVGAEVEGADEDIVRLGVRDGVALGLVVGVSVVGRGRARVQAHAARLTPARRRAAKARIERRRRASPEIRAGRSGFGLGAVDAEAAGRSSAPSLRSCRARPEPEV